MREITRKITISISGDCTNEANSANKANFARQIESRFSIAWFNSNNNISVSFKVEHSRNYCMNQWYLPYRFTNLHSFLSKKPLSQCYNQIL